MQTLMISLDKNILDKNSMAAKRMVVYGKKSDLFIIIPEIGVPLCFASFAAFNEQDKVG